MEDIRKNKKISFKRFLNICGFSFKIYIQPDPINGILLFGSETIVRITGIVNTFIIAKIIDIVVNTIQKNGTVQAVIPYILLLTAFDFLSKFLSGARWYFRAKSERKFWYYSDIIIHDHYKTLGVPVLEDPDKNNITHRGMQEINQASTLFFTILDAFVALTNVIISGITIMYFLPSLVYVIIIWIIIRNIPEMYFMKAMYKYGFINTEKIRKNKFISGYILNKVSIIELNIHNASVYLKEKYEKFIKEFVGGWIALRKRMFYTTSFFNFSSAFIFFWAYTSILRKIIQEHLSVGRLYFQMSMVDRFSGNLDQLIVDITSLYETALRLDDTYQLFHLTPNFPDGTKILKETKLSPEIICDNISFKYPNTDKYILKNFNLIIKPGEKIAIVGVNGAGKTTLTKLLLRFYQVNDGKILIDKEDINDLKIDEYYKNVGTLFQDYSTYGALTAEENIYIGDVQKPVDKEKVIKAAKKSDAHEFIDKYNEKYNQILSESFTGGIRPSTGQWQKIAISRLFYRNPKLVIFDEPTASIDAESEYKIFNNIYDFFKGKTVIIISHRFSTVRNADRIILIDGGQILEQGNHEELLKLNGKYAHAFKLQAQGYQIDKDEDGMIDL